MCLCGERERARERESERARERESEIARERESERARFVALCRHSCRMCESSIRCEHMIKRFFLVCAIISSLSPAPGKKKAGKAAPKGKRGKKADSPKKALVITQSEILRRDGIICLPIKMSKLFAGKCPR